MRRHSLAYSIDEPKLDTERTSFSPKSYVNLEGIFSKEVEEKPTSYSNFSPQPKLRLLEKTPEMLETERYEQELDAKVKAENDYWESDNVLEIERIMNGRGKNYFKLNDRFEALNKYINSESFVKDAELLKSKSSKDYLTITFRINEELKKMSNDPKYTGKIQQGKLDANLYSTAMENMGLALKKLKSKSVVYHNIEENRLRRMKENPSHFFPEDLHKNKLISDNEFTKYKEQKAISDKIKVKKKRNKIIAGVAAASIVVTSLFAGGIYTYLNHNIPKFDKVTSYRVKNNPIEYVLASFR